jgi:hypothetical protein
MGGETLNPVAFAALSGSALFFGKPSATLK